MLSDLRKVQDKLFANESIEEFLKAHSIHEVLKFLNKTNKAETQTRLRQFLYKINESNLYKEFLLAGLTQSEVEKAEFQKYIVSENSEEYFQLVQKKVADVLALLDNNNALVPVIFSLVHSPLYGIKMVKLFSQLYSKYSNHNCLFSQQIKQQLIKGLQSQDTVVQMRFVQIIANIAIHGGKSFEFVKEALNKSLDIYKTEDILLKLNIVQIISVMGQGIETSAMLRGHNVWPKIQKDALDSSQQFYVRKSLLMLLVNMATFQQYQMTPKFTKNVIQFLGECFKGQGEYLQAGLQVTGHLLRSNQGIKILVQNTEVFGSYLKLSRSPQDRVKNLFVQNMTILSDKTNGKKTKPMVLNILTCVGNPNLGNEFSHNIHSNNIISGGIPGFCQWFVGLLQLPFEDLELKLINLFINLLQYVQICEQLFQNQNSTKYILKPIPKGNTTKVLRGQKNRFVHSLIEKGKKEWKNTKLEQYTVMVEKQLLKDKMQMEIELEAQ